MSARTKSVIALTFYVEQQAKERDEWEEAWVDSVKIFTKENGDPLHPAWVTTSFLHIAFEAGLPPIRLHDLRHGAATLARSRCGRTVCFPSSLMCALEVRGDGEHLRAVAHVILHRSSVMGLVAKRRLVRRPPRPSPRA